MITLEHVFEDLVSTVAIRALEASILLLALVTVVATPAVAVAVYAAFATAFIMEKTSRYRYCCSVTTYIKEGYRSNCIRKVVGQTVLERL